MTDERTIAAILSASISSAIAIGGALIQRGRREERFEELEKAVAEHTEALRDSEKALQEKVSLALFKEEIAELHARISRTQREQAAAIAELDKKVDALAGEIKFMSSVLSTLPSKLDELTKEMRSR